MFLRKEASGVYHIYYNDCNVKRSITTKCRIKSEALLFLSEFKKHLEEKQNKKIIPIKLLDLQREILALYKAGYSLKTFLGIRYYINNLIKYFGADRYLSDILPVEFEKYLLRFAAEHKESYVREFQAKLVRILNIAKENKYLYSDFEIKKLRLKVKEKMPRYFSIEEFKKFYIECKKPVLKNMALLAINTGMRVNEIVSLTWQDIDINQKTIKISGSQTKNKKVAVIPLNETAELLLKELYLKRTECEYVFNTRNRTKYNCNNISNIFHAEVERIFGKNSGLSFHKLRHTFASFLVQKGVPIFSVSKLMRHSNISTTLIYSHMQPETLRSEVELIKINLN